MRECGYCEITKLSKIGAEPSKYCMVLELLKCTRERGHHPPVQYLLCKITQLCLVVVLLFPFLITYNTLIQQASGEGVEGAVANSIAKIPNIQPELDLRHYQLQFRKVFNHNKSEPSRKPRRGYNNYSLIVLSQSAYNLSHFPQLKNARSKRDSRGRKQPKLAGELDKYQSIQAHNAMYNDIDKAKLAELIVSGLGLKKLPDMKKVRRLQTREESLFYYNLLFSLQANISQLEYSSKYIEYLQRIRRNVEKQHEEESPNQLQASLQLLSIVTNRFSELNNRQWHHKRAIRAAKICERSRGGAGAAHRASIAQNERTNILLHFPLTVNGSQVNYERIDEANVRLMMLYNPSLSVPNAPNAASKLAMKKNRKNCNKLNKKMPPSSASPSSRTHAVHLKIFQLLHKNRRLQLDVRRIELESAKGEETRSQWLEFDVTEAVRGWLNRTYENLGIEIQCDRCRRFGARILSDHAHHEHDHNQEQAQSQFQLTPVLNIIGHVARPHQSATSTSTARANQSQNYFYHRLTLDYPEQSKQKWPNSCYRAHQRCCRHQLDVTFKDLKGFEFIIQPKTFDAGFCKGRCPPRHNPAHHHALLQSLMWQQQHGRVPRPCCVPSKLTQLEILHVDEEHTDKLKISTWSDMQVVECACA